MYEFFIRWLCRTKIPKISRVFKTQSYKAAKNSRLILGPLILLHHIAPDPQTAAKAFQRWLLPGAWDSWRGIAFWHQFRQHEFLSENWYHSPTIWFSFEEPENDLSEMKSHWPVRIHSLSGMLAFGILWIGWPSHVQSVHFVSPPARGSASRLDPKKPDQDDKKSHRKTCAFLIIFQVKEPAVESCIYLPMTFILS